MTTEAVVPASLVEAVRIAAHHLRSAQRLRGRYNAEMAIQGHEDAALAILEKTLRAEDDTSRTELPKTPQR